MLPAISVKCCLLRLGVAFITQGVITSHVARRGILWQQTEAALGSKNDAISAPMPPHSVISSSEQYVGSTWLEHLSRPGV